SPRETRQLDLISQFTSDIRHVEGVNNSPTDALFRIAAVQKAQLDIDALAQAQAEDPELQELKQMEKFTFSYIASPTSEFEVCYEKSQGHRLYVPQAFPREVVELTHNLAHPGIRGTRKLVARKYFWPSMNADTA